jgi:hypothetical protein
MFQNRRLIITLGVIALLLLTFGAAAAKDNDKPKLPHGGAGHGPASIGKPAHLSWTPGRIMQAVTAGQTLQITATFSSSADIAEATLFVPGGLGKVLKADQAKLTAIKAGTPTTVTFTVTMPATRAHTQGGVVQMRVGQRMLAPPLSVLLTVANGNDAEDKGTPKPGKPTRRHPKGE